MGAPGKLAALQVLRDRDQANVAPTFGFAGNAASNGTGGGVAEPFAPGAAPARASSGTRS